MFIARKPIECDTYMPSENYLAAHEGYILKRAGVVDDDGVRAISVQLIYTSEESTVELLREVLRMFHRLALLARLRNITDSVHGMLPIHVAAAQKGCKAVSSAIRWSAPINGRKP